LNSDPGELANLAANQRHASQRADLARQLDDWMQRTKDPFMELTTTDRSGRIVTGQVTK
jgi:hypothetical protein